MERRNHLPKNHPYSESKTELQWKKEKRVILAGVTGGRLYANGFRRLICNFYTLKETRPATEEELESWRAERREKERTRRAKIRDKE